MTSRLEVRRCRQSGKAFNVNRLIAGCVSMFILIGSIGGLAASEQTACDDRSDLAAIALTSLEPELSGYQHLGAFDESMETEVFTMASYLERNPNEVREVLTSAGWDRKYMVQSSLPPQGSSSRTSQFVYSYVTEYCDAAGASTAFGILEDETNSQTAEDIGAFRTFGGEMDFTADQGLDNENRPFRTLDLSMRVGNLVGGVTVTVYPTLEGSSPDQAFVETLGAVLEDHLENPPEPGPGFTLARLDPAAAVTFDDAYFRRNGIDLPLADESDEAAAIRTGGYAGAVDVYQLFQDISSESGRHVLYSLTIYRLDTPKAAAGWVRDAPQLLQENPYYASVVPLTEPGTSADDGSVFQFDAGGVGVTAVLMVVARSNEVHRVQLVPSDEGATDLITAADALMQEQLRCAESGTCAAISVPGELLQVVDASSDELPGTPAAAN